MRLKQNDQKCLPPLILTKNFFRKITTLTTLNRWNAYIQGIFAGVVIGVERVI